MERNREMQSFDARIKTFETEHQLSKRRASSQQSRKKAGAHVLKWPHESPSGQDLARAGFFYRPAIDSEDNVQCFLCTVKLDGWEPSDDPIQEHLAHMSSCDWAISLSTAQAAFQAAQDGNETALLQQPDPMDPELVAARRGTFEANGGEWPHESKKGWKCKVTKMVEAGWCYDPAHSTPGDEEEMDGVTCFYCDKSLDGWEPKDDPLKEHQKRSPGCVFFKLVKMYGSEPGKKGKGKKGAARSSAAGKGSRISSQSAMSQMSEAPSLADFDLPAEDEEMAAARVDDSVLTTDSQATATRTGKDKKGKAGRAKAPTKTTKGRKRAGTVDSQADAPLYPDISTHVQSKVADAEETTASQQQVEEPEPAPPAKRTRKAATRGSKAPQIDSSVLEISSLDLAPQAATKPKRGRKPKAKAEPEPTAEIEKAAELDSSEVSAQLQEELDRSLSIDMDARFEVEEKEAVQPEKAKRGTKRTSDGLKKAQAAQEDSDLSATVMEFPAPPKPTAPAAKAKKGRKASKQIEAELVPPPEPSMQEDATMSDVEATKPAKGKKGGATKGKGKGKKASSARSSRSSRTTATEQKPSQEEEEEEDLDRDEREIEAELERIAAEQAKIQEEQERAAEFEASPSTTRHAPKKTTRKASQQPSPKVVEDVAGSPPDQSPVLHRANPTPSPAGSDKENDPSTASLTKENAPAPQPMMSPTKTTRIPLAPGTPNRTLTPSKRTLLSPSKQVPRLTSSNPWEPIDLDAVLLASPQPTPGTLATRLAGVAGAGALASPEKGMSVEEWVRFQAGKAEDELKRKCEEMVGVFEREGMRALGVLEGLGAVA